MSVMYCHTCGQFIDTDYDAEHFGEDGESCATYPEDECETTQATQCSGGSNGPNN